MAVVGSLTVDLKAETASFNSNIAKAAAHLNSNAARMNRSVAGIKSSFDSMANAAKVASFALAGSGFLELTKNALHYAAGLKETAQQVGVTAQQLQVFNFIGGQLGVTQQEMEKGLQKLTLSMGQARLGAEGPAKAFAGLNTVLGQNILTTSKTAGEALPKMAEALSRVTDATQRAAIEKVLLGRAGQQLDGVLTQGAKGLDNWAARARAAGLVISDELIDKADEAEDKMAKLTLRLKVSFAREVAENAGAIIGMVDALDKLATMAGNVIASMPRLATGLSGVAKILQFTTPLGITAGLAGSLGRAYYSEHSSTDLPTRTKHLNDATVRMTYATSTGLARRDPKAFAAARARLEEQRQLMGLTQSVAAARAVPAGVDLSNFLAPGGGGGGRSRSARSGADTAERARDKAIADAAAFANDLARLDADLLSAKRDNLADITKIGDIDRQQLTVETDQLKAGIAADLATGKYTAAQAEQLTVKVDQVKAEKLLTIHTEELERQASGLLNLAIAQNDNQRDLLGAQEQLAVTQAERRTIQLKLLALERQEEELKQRNIIAMSRDPNERLAAQQRLDAMPALYQARGEGVKNQTAGPLEAYLKSTDPKLIQERVDGLVVDELLAVRDGINSAISSALGINNPMLKGLIDLFLEQVLIRPIAAALQKAQANSGGGGLGSILGAVAGIFGGGLSASGIASSNLTVGATIAGRPDIFAAGGAVRGPGTGTSDSIMARLSNGEFVMSASAVRRLGVGNLSAMNQGGHPRFASGGMVGRAPAFTPRNDNGHTFNFQFSGAYTPNQGRETGSQAGREVLRVINGPLRKAG